MATVAALRRSAFRPAFHSPCLPSASIRRPLACAAVRTFTSSPISLGTIKRYTRDHEYIVLSPKTQSATIGITTYAANALGDVVYVELPNLDARLVKGEPFAAVESVKSASDIIAPISGTVVEVNESLLAKPGLINQDPEGTGGEGGWIAKVEVEEQEGLTVEEQEGLMGEEDYTEFCKQD